ncbi:signal peptidase I [Fuchsiella alkaliacetigena]|uniref:signal peptidase I n=1 Tax=Fuchsiella alkaliacetigena TaxID=957042 RepID=UPI00200B34F0|nr:signal peptidase I [Fuchsiella alkaliacetigena]MCK8825641.1 signal peptidase I [Fuchsiella alkaliacetigena]
MAAEKSKLREYIEAVGIAVVLAFLIITFVVQAFYIPSGSMEPTLEPGDRIFVNKFIYRFRDPERFDIMVFDYPVDPSMRFIKRVIGLPGEEVKIEGGKVHIDGEPIEEDYTLQDSYSDYSPVEVPADHYFVLGDNRNNSEDSRYWGFVPRDKVIGKSLVRFWPLTRLGRVE